MITRRGILIVLAVGHTAQAFEALDDIPANKGGGKISA